MAREERNRAIRERNEARQEVEYLWTELGTTVARRLDVEEATVGLRADLADAWGLLQAEGDEYDRMSSAVLVVYDNLQVVQEEGTSSLAAHAAGIMARVGQLEESAFHAGITQVFTVAHSHYEKEINLLVMSEGFPPTYEDDELDAIEKAVAPLVKNLADSLKEMVLPSRK